MEKIPIDGKKHKFADMGYGFQPTFRVLVSVTGKPLKLEEARCSRTLWAKGAIGEMVELGGSEADLTEAQSERLEQFIRSVPVDGQSYTLAEALKGRHQELRNFYHAFITFDVQGNHDIA